MANANDDVKVWFELYGEDITTPYDNPLPHASLFDYHIYLYDKCRELKRLIAVYKKSNTGLYAIGTDASNELTIVFNRELSRTLKSTEIFAEVRVKIDSTSDFIDAKAVTSLNEIFLFELVTSPSPNSMS